MTDGPPAAAVGAKRSGSLAAADPQPVAPWGVASGVRWPAIACWSLPATAAGARPDRNLTVQPKLPQPSPSASTLEGTVMPKPRRIGDSARLRADWLLRINPARQWPSRGSASCLIHAAYLAIDAVNASDQLLIVAKPPCPTKRCSSPKQWHGGRNRSIGSGIRIGMHHVGR